MENSLEIVEKRYSKKKKSGKNIYILEEIEIVKKIQIVGKNVDSGNKYRQWE